MPGPPGARRLTLINRNSVTEEEPAQVRRQCEGRLTTGNFPSRRRAWRAATGDADNDASIFFLQPAGRPGAAGRTAPTSCGCPPICPAATSPPPRAASPPRCPRSRRGTRPASVADVRLWCRICGASPQQARRTGRRAGRRCPAVDFSFRDLGGKTGLNATQKTSVRRHVGTRPALPRPTRPRSSPACCKPSPY